VVTIQNQRTRCVICNNEGFLLKKVGRYNIYKCKNCGLEYIYPMPIKGVLEKFYSNYGDFRADVQVLKKNALRNIKALSKYGLSKNSRLLDFGCGKNIFVKTSKSPYWFGYDKYATSQFKIVSDYCSNNWNFITMWGVLEHLPKPKETLQGVVKYLNVGGKLALTTVTTESNIPYQHKPPKHITFWTKKAIQTLFSLIGLKILEYHAYEMIQKSDVYLRYVLRTVPEKYKFKIYHKLPRYIEVPTNEIFVVGEK